HAERVRLGPDLDNLAVAEAAEGDGRGGYLLARGRNRGFASNGNGNNVKRTAGPPLASRGSTAIDRRRRPRQRPDLPLASGACAAGYVESWCSCSGWRRPSRWPACG